jgi:hypothetical protein
MTTKQRPSTNDATLSVQERVAAGNAAIDFLCDVLSDESAPDERRAEAAEILRPYYHARLAKMGPLLEQFGK